VDGLWQDLRYGVRLLKRTPRNSAIAVAILALGITLDRAPRLNLAQTIAWKDGIVDRLSNGVSGLLAHAKVRVVQGAPESTTMDVDAVNGPTLASGLRYGDSSDYVTVPGGHWDVALKYGDTSTPATNPSGTTVAARANR